MRVRAAAIVQLLALVAGVMAVAISSAAASGPPSSAASASNGHGSRPACPGPAAPGHARCHAQILDLTKAAPAKRGSTTTTGPTTTAPTTTGPTTTAPTTTVAPSTTVAPPTTTPATTFGCATHPSGGPAGFAPCDLQNAYSLPSATAGSGQTVAIVDAFDDPNAEADLGVYRNVFGLSPCTTANGCFKKVNQSGQASPLPAGDNGWGEEISLDVDMVSAICQNCHILLVEASSTSFSDLGTAVNTAASMGAQAISNSYGGNECTAGFLGLNCISASDQSYYNHPGHAITVSSGDGGYGVEFPASSQYVTAVGGTSLSRASNARGWTESAWSGAGSGCSNVFAKPTWQHDTGCSKRTVADVSADADPNTGVAVYDTYNAAGQTSTGGTGWMVFGGTSVASPIVASVYALAGNGGTVNYGSYPYGHTSSLWDVTGGSNGSCSPAYLCTGEPGYDGPTGLGTPNGTAAF